MADTLSLPVDLSRLAAPFPPDAISWRVGSTNSDKTKGLALAYIDARDVMDRLDAVCGVTGWQNEFIETPKGRIMCRIGIRTADGWVWKGDGAGETDVESEKGAISDALKRAAVHWGVGRYLYSLPATWVQIEQRGKSSIIKDSERARLRAVAAKSTGATTAPQSPAPDAASENPPLAGRRTNIVVNPATGREIDTENARNQRPEWAKFADTVQGYIDGRDADGLKAWFASDKIAAYVAGWVFKDQAHEHIEGALDAIERMERMS